MKTDQGPVDHQLGEKTQKEDVATVVMDELVRTATAQAGEEEPTADELSTLRKVAAPFPFPALAMCTIEVAERASYYGCSGVFANFVRAPLPKGGNGAGAVALGQAGLNQTAGALGLGSVAAAAVTTAFTFLAYFIPIFGAIIADKYWGRYKTIMIGVVIGIVGHALLVVAAIPSVIETGHALAPFLLGVLILAGSTGLIKPSLAPLLCDQSPVRRPVIRNTKQGKRVIVDPQITIRKYLSIFYWCINVGGVFAIASQYQERLVGFWLAFLTPGIIYLLLPLVLVFTSSRLIKLPPQGTVLLEAMRVLRILLGGRNIKRWFRRDPHFWERAKPSYMLERDGHLDAKVIWDDQFVDEIRETLNACGIFLLLTIYNLCDNGAIGSIESIQSASMHLNGIPNDITSNFNALAIVVFAPVVTYGINPFFERIGHPLKPMTRMCIGYILGGSSMVMAAIIQWRIYSTSPCGYYATTCAQTSPVAVAWQVPLYALPAIGELFVKVTAYEIAYTAAPARMKGLVFALNLFAQALASAIGLAAAPVIKDPYMIWPYVAVGVLCFICAVIFPTYYRHMNEPVPIFADLDRQRGLQQPGAVSQGQEIQTKSVVC